MAMLRYADIFCGIGGFRIAMEQVCAEDNIPATCVFSCDIDPDARKCYQENFGDHPYHDLTTICNSDIPDHDILFAGFPCQPFSICGEQRGFDDARGNLFFELTRILESKRPAAFLLENVKMLVGHRQGKTLQHILKILSDIGYQTDYRILNALEFGLPQKRERVFIVGFLEETSYPFFWPSGTPSMLPLSAILERDVSEFYYASEYIKQQRLHGYQGKRVPEPTIWHENKCGHISAYPFSCALRAGASYNYLLVNGERRLTEREMLRLQGFPDWFKISCSYQACRRLIGNSVAIPCVTSVIRSIVSVIKPVAYRIAYGEIGIPMQAKMML